MATSAQLQSEPEYNRETTPGALAVLGVALRQHFKLPANAIGFKGDTEHLYGYHRSRAWVKASRFCTNTTYSVSETPGNRKGGESNWVCAIDVTLPTKDLLAVCKRLDAASRAGTMEKVTEWYGNKDGNQQVDGWDNIRNEVASSDDSHLWHLHMSFDRGRANEDHTDVLNILTGADDMSAEDSKTIKHVEAMVSSLGKVANATAADVVELANAVSRLEEPVTVSLTDEDRAAIVAGLATALLDQLRAHPLAPTP